MLLGRKEGQLSREILGQNFFRPDDDVGCARSSGTCCSSIPVRIGFRTLREMIVDDMRNVRQVESAARQVGADEHADGAAAQSDDRLVAHLLVQAAMIQRILDALVRQVMRDAFSCFPIVGKHDGLLGRPFLLLAKQAKQQFVQGFELVGNRRFHLIDCQSFGLLLVTAEVELCIVVEARPGRNGDGMGGRGEDALLDAGQGVEDGMHLFLEAQFQRFVELVDHQEGEPFRLDVASFDVILQSAWSSDNQVLVLCPLFAKERLKLLLLGTRVVSAVAGHTSDFGMQALPDVGYLLDEFAAWGNDEHLPFGFPERQQEGKRLAAPGRGEQQDVASFRKKAEHFFLHLVERSKAKCI